MVVIELHISPKSNPNLNPQSSPWVQSPGFTLTLPLDWSNGIGNEEMEIEMESRTSFDASRLLSYIVLSEARSIPGLDQVLYGFFASF